MKKSWQKDVSKWQAESKRRRSDALMAQDVMEYAHCGLFVLAITVLATLWAVASRLV